MSRFDKWIIEQRDEAGGLDFSKPEPYEIFGMESIHGITEDEMARKIFSIKKDAVMDGRYIADWPKIVNPKWTARRKTW